MKRLSPRERAWVAAVLALILCLGAKTYWFDPWSPNGPDEEARFAAALKAMDAEPAPWAVRNGIVQERIVAIKEIKPEGQDAPPTLKITVRSYVGGFLPFGDRKLTIPDKGL